MIVVIASSLYFVNKIKTRQFTQKLKAYLITEGNDDEFLKRIKQKVKNMPNCILKEGKLIDFKSDEYDLVLGFDYNFNKLINQYYIKHETSLDFRSLVVWKQISAKDSDVSNMEISSLPNRGNIVISREAAFSLRASLASSLLLSEISDARNAYIQLVKTPITANTSYIDFDRQATYKSLEWMAISITRSIKADSLIPIQQHLVIGMCNTTKYPEQCKTFIAKLKEEMTQPSDLERLSESAITELNKTNKSNFDNNLKVSIKDIIDIIDNIE